MGIRAAVCVAQYFIQDKAINDSRLSKAILELPDNNPEHLPGYLPLVPVVKRPTKILVKCKALPLIPVYSITTHKSQGQTLRKSFADLVTPPGSVEVASVYLLLPHVKRL
ncbi:unnamed protein product, partial [Rotaria magnacalcarata]